MSSILQPVQLAVLPEGQGQMISDSMKSTSIICSFPAALLGLSIRDLELLTIGMVNDMYVESRNDGCAYAELATQADFDNF